MERGVLDAVAVAIRLRQSCWYEGVAFMSAAFSDTCYMPSDEPGCRGMVSASLDNHPGKSSFSRALMVTSQDLHLTNVEVFLDFGHSVGYDMIRNAPYTIAFGYTLLLMISQTGRLWVTPAWG